MAICRLPELDANSGRFYASRCDRLVFDLADDLAAGSDYILKSAADEKLLVYGISSGALKAAVREHLARSPYVKRARPAEQHEGGDQVTVVELRG